MTIEFFLNTQKLVFSYYLKMENKRIPKIPYMRTLIVEK